MTDFEISLLKIFKNNKTKYFKIQRKYVYVNFPQGCGNKLVLKHSRFTVIHDRFWNKTKLRADVSGKPMLPTPRGMEKRPWAQEEKHLNCACALVASPVSSPLGKQPLIKRQRPDAITPGAV